MPKHLTHFITFLVLLSLISTGRHAASASQAPLDISVYFPYLSKPDFTYFALVANAKPSPPPETIGWLGLQGGFVMSVVIDPEDSDVVYIAVWGSGVYKSTDGGQNWQPARAGFGNQLVWSLAVDPKNSNVLYAGTHKGGLYKSEDGGDTWFLSSNGIQKSAVVYSIAIDPLDSDRVFLGTRGIAAICSGGESCPPWAGVLYKSGNAGDSWTPSLQNIGGSDNQFWPYVVAFDPVDPVRVFATIDGAPGLYRSVDGGRSWSSNMSGVANPKGRAIAFDPTSPSPHIDYYGGWQAHNYINLFKSTNGGDTWSPKNSGISSIDIWKMAVTYTSPPTVFACTYHNGLLKSTNGGSTWKNAGVPATKVNAVAVDTVRTNVVYAGSAEGGLFKSTDGGSTWATIENGLITTWSTSLLVSPDDINHLFMSTYGQGVFQSTDRGANWSAMNGGLGDLYVHSMVMDPAHPNILFALTDTKGLYRYDLSAGGNWTHITGNLPALAQGALAPGQGGLSYGPDYPFALPELPDSDVYPDLFADQRPAAVAAQPPYLAMTYAPSDPAVAYLGTFGSGVYKSGDGGSGWDAAGLSGLVAWSLAVDPANPDLVYAATSTPGSIKVSSTGGGAWADSPLPDAGLIAYALVAAPDNSGSLYAGTTNGVYRLAGGSWTSLGLAGNTITAVAVNPQHAGFIYAGTSNGAYFSFDSGATWLPGPAGLANLTVQAINFDPFYPNTIYISTTGNGVLRVPFD